MTQGIRNFLNLPSLEDIMKEQGVSPPSEEEATESLDEEDIDPAFQRTLEQAETRLAMVSGRDHEVAMDQVYRETLKHAQDLMDLGFNIDTPRARGIFEVATSMYGQAISAKNSKRDAQLKAMKLALDQRKIDLEEKRLKAELGETENNTIEGEGTVMREDRNELIKRMRAEREKK